MAAAAAALLASTLCPRVNSSCFKELIAAHSALEVLELGGLDLAGAVLTLEVLPKDCTSCS